MSEQEAILLPIKSSADLRAMERTIAELERVDAWLENINKRRVVINMQVDGAGELRSTVQGMEKLVGLLRTAGAGDLGERLKRDLITPGEAADQSRLRVQELSREIQTLHRAVAFGEGELKGRKIMGATGTQSQADWVLEIDNRRQEITEAQNKIDALQRQATLLSHAAGAGDAMRGTQYSRAVADDAERAAAAAAESAAAAKARAEAEASTAKSAKETAATEKAAAAQKKSTAKAVVDTSRPGLLGVREVVGESVTAKFATASGTTTESTTGRIVHEQNKLAQFRQQAAAAAADFAGKQSTAIAGGRTPEVRIALLREEAAAYGSLAKAMREAGLGAYAAPYERRSAMLMGRADSAQQAGSAAAQAQQLRDAEARARRDSASFRKQQAQQARQDADEVRRQSEIARARARDEEQRRSQLGTALSNRDARNRFRAFGGTEGRAMSSEDDGGRTVTRTRTSEDGRRIQLTERYDKAGQQLGFTIKDLGDKHERVKAPVKSLGEQFYDNTVKVAKWSASVAVLYGALGAMKSGFESAFDLDRKLATLSAVFRGTREDARGLMQDTLALGAAQGRSADEAADAAIRWARMGFTRAQAAEAVRVTLMAANVAEVSAGEAAQHLAAIYQTTGGSIGELAGKLGMMNSLSNTLNVTTKDLLEGFGRVGALAKQAGFSFAEVQGIIGTTASTTARSGAEIGNALKALIVSVSNPEVQAFLKGRFGIDLRDSKGEMRGGSEIMRELFIATRGMSRGDMGEMLVKVAGKQQASRVQAMLENYVDSQANAITAQRNLNSAQSENNRILETTVAHWERLKTTWATAFDSLHQNVTKGPLNGLLDMLSDSGKGVSAIAVRLNPNNYANGKLGIRADNYQNLLPYISEEAKKEVLAADQSKKDYDAAVSARRLLRTVGASAQQMPAGEFASALGKLVAASTNDTKKQDDYLKRGSDYKSAGNYAGISKLMSEMDREIEARLPSLMQKTKDAGNKLASSADFMDREAGKMASELDSNIALKSGAATEGQLAAAAKQRQNINSLRELAKMMRGIGVEARAVLPDEELDMNAGSRLEKRQLFDIADARRRAAFSTPFFGQGIEGMAGMSQLNSLNELISRQRFISGNKDARGEDFDALRLEKERMKSAMPDARRQDLDSKTLRAVDLALASRGGATPELAARSRISFIDSTLGQPRQEGRDQHLQTIALANAALREQLSLQRGIADIDAQIAAERQRQNIEAGKALIMAGREDQLRAALMERYTQQNGKMTREQFMFMSPEAKQSALRFNPSGTPDDVNGIGELNKRRDMGGRELERVEKLIADFAGIVGGAGAALAGRGALQAPPVIMQPEFNMSFGPQFSGLLDVVQQAAVASLEQSQREMLSMFDTFLRSSVGPKQTAAPAL